MSSVEDIAPSVGPEAALTELATQLRNEGSVISAFVEPTSQAPALGMLASAGPRAAAARADYSLLVECVREGYLLHYSEPRVIRGADANLELLAGDYLYARGLERLAGLGDIQSVRELSDLISLLAQVHTAPEPNSGGPATLWLSSVVAVAAGQTEAHERAKAGIRMERPGSLRDLAAVAGSEASRCGIEDELALAAKTVGLKNTDLFDFG